MNLNYVSYEHIPRYSIPIETDDINIIKRDDVKNVTLAYMSDGDNLYISASICNTKDKVNRKEGNRVARERLEEFIKTNSGIGIKISFIEFMDIVFPERTDCTQSIFYTEPITIGYFDIKYLKENCNFKCISNSFIHHNFKHFTMFNVMLAVMLAKLVKKEIVRN